MLFHTDRTTKSAGSGSVTADNAAFSSKRTVQYVKIAPRTESAKTGLTSTIDPRNQIEAVQGSIGCGIDEISDSTGGVV